MAITLPSLALNADDLGLGRYLREIRQFPMLEVEEEYMLAKRWVDYQDTAAAHKLVTSHLRLAAKIAMGYRHYGLPLADLISEGNIGLMRAVRKFDPEKGFRLATYALWWIKASLNEFVLNSWSLVKIGTQAAQKKLFFNLRRIKARLACMNRGVDMDGSDMRPETVRLIADELGVEERDVIAMNRRMVSRDSSLHAPAMEDGTPIMDLIADETDNQEQIYGRNQELSKGRALIDAALAQLTQREREIFTARRLSEDPVTLEELGERYGVSRERVRQLEVRAFAKVQSVVTQGFLPTKSLPAA